MVNYAKSVKIYLGKYSEFQKSTSKEIKRIGGWGTIHGCIVDIDFYNHLYLNPIDGSVTPYNAESMVSKHVYSNVASLLKYCAPQLYENYIHLLEERHDDNGSTSAIVGADDAIDNATVFVPDTDMYRVSKIIKGLQFTTKFNVVRLWNYSWADEASEEAGRLIVASIINPELAPEVEDWNKLKRAKSSKDFAAAEKTKKGAEPKQRTSKISYFEKHRKRVEEVCDGTVELTELPDSRTNATLKCSKCGHIWSQRIDHFYRNPVCPNCHGR